MIIGSLNPQEVSVAVESIGTAVQVADVTGDHLFVAALQVPLGEMNGVGEVDYLPQKIRTSAEALYDAGHLRTPRTCAPIIVGGKCFARGVGVFDDANLR